MSLLGIGRSHLLVAMIRRRENASRSRTGRGTKLIRCFLSESLAGGDAMLEGEGSGGMIS